MPLYEKLIFTNVSTLSLSLEFCLVEPFSLCEAPGAHSSATTKVHISLSLVVNSLLLFLQLFFISSSRRKKLNDFGVIHTFALAPP